MNKLLMNRRRLLGLGAAGASTLMLSGCDWFDGHLTPGDDLRSTLEKANSWTYKAQRLLADEWQRR